LHEWTNDSWKLPPHDSPLAFWRSTPSITARVETGNFVDALTRPDSSAAAAVTILKTDPGGCGAENATPASARTSALRASSAAIPPKRPASAVTAAAWMPRSIVVRTGRARRGAARASRRLPAISVPPGTPATCSSTIRSRPERPVGQVRGNPRA
jgi:hypothetical protein